MHIIGVIFTIAFGSLLHFTYKLSGYNTIIGIFSAINESVWEHIKLLFFPTLIFLVPEYLIYGKDKGNFFFAKFVSISIGMASIPIIFYTYSGIVGNNYLLMDILTFIISVILTYTTSYNIIKADKNYRYGNVVGILLIILYSILFAIFTFYPPKISLFLSP